MGIRKTKAEIINDLGEIISTLIRDPSLSDKSISAVEKLIELKVHIGLKFIDDCDIIKLLPSEDNMYKELERKFNLGKHHDDGMQIDDTQIGWEKCFEWVTKTLQDKQ